jgi:hypothetical protein
MRTLLTVSAVVLVAGATAGCSGVPDTDMAASVGSSTLTHDELFEIMAINEIPTSSAADARSTVASWITLRAASDRLAEQGVVVTDDERAATTTRLETVPVWDELSTSTQEVAIDLTTANELLTRLSNQGIDVIAVIEEAFASADIEVDPRIGTFDGVGDVVALGR